MQASRTGQGRAVLSEVQTRHHDIKHIEKTIVASFEHSFIWFQPNVPSKVAGF